MVNSCIVRTTAFLNSFILAHYQKLPMNGESLNLTEDLIAQLQAIVPAAFSEGKLDVEKLKTLIGEESVNKGERYELNWPGKADAYKVLQRPTTETLVPNPEDSINWDETENVFIEGENLAVLKVLQKSYYGKIKMIYIDPPYNTGSDSFIYPDKFSETKEEYAQRVGDKDEEGYMMKEGMFRKNSKDGGHYHSNWLNMMLPRLHLARNLLTEDGVIFVSIDDNEQANLKLLMDQVFGEENFLGCIVRSTGQTTGQDSGGLGSSFDYILSYIRTDEYSLSGIKLTEKDLLRFDNEDDRGKYAYDQMRKTGSNDRREDRPNLFYTVHAPDGTEVVPIAPAGYESCWRFGKKTYEKLLKDDYILWKKTKRNDEEIWWPYVKYYAEGRTKRPSPLWTDLDGNKKASRALRDLFDGKKVFSFPKPIALLQRLIQIAPNSNSNDLILDFFSGSGALAESVMELNEEDGGNRKFICVQLPEKTEESSEAYKAGYTTISAIAEARIKKVIEKIEEERSGKLALDDRQVLGFRKFTLQESNFKVWRGDVDDVETLKQQMQLFVTPEREGALTENILWELLVKNGKLLTENLTQHEVEDGVVWSIEDGSIAFALDVWNASVTDKLLELKPQKVIALDSVFDQDDARKSNAQLQCEDAGINFTTV
jgi:adenine-specific DNA-methyltransferase